MTTGTRPRQATSSHSRCSLTARQATPGDVWRHFGLAASGLSNKQVAVQLYLSVATVEAHLSRLYAKLGIRSRTQLARHLGAPA